jgi:hypothetical protein
VILFGAVLGTTRHLICETGRPPFPLDSGFVARFILFFAMVLLQVFVEVPPSPCLFVLPVFESWMMVLAVSFTLIH